MQNTIYWIEIIYSPLLESFYGFEYLTFGISGIKNASCYITFSNNEVVKFQLSEHFTHL